jgi:5-methylcytosine-specific restriction endonuclease McrA
LIASTAGLLKEPLQKLSIDAYSVSIVRRKARGLGLPLTDSSSRVGTLLAALGIDAESLSLFLEWALAEHLVHEVAHHKQIDANFFSRPDSLRAFRNLLFVRTGREWSTHDLNALYDRVQGEQTKHFRQPIKYEEYLKLLWQVPLRCARCQREPPAVKLHVDHIVPASLGGKSERGNLQFLCSQHNLEKSNKREVTERWLDLQ